MPGFQEAPNNSTTKEFMSTNDDLAFVPAAELRRLIGVGAVSAAEVVSAALDRIERHNDAVNAVVTLSSRALDDARELDESHARGEAIGSRRPGPSAALRSWRATPHSER